MQWRWSSCWELVHGGDLFDYVIVSHMMPNPSAATPSSSDLRIVLHYIPWTNSEQGFTTFVHPCYNGFMNCRVVSYITPNTTVVPFNL